MLLFILGIVCLLICLLVLIGSIGVKEEDGINDYKQFKEFSKAASVIAGFIAVILIFMSSITSIPTGHTGVITSFGKVKDYVYDAGLNFKLPWCKIVKLDNRTQKETLETSCFSKDIQEVNVLFTLNYKIQKENAQQIYKTIGKEYYDTVVMPCVQEAIKTTTAKYTAEELVGMRKNLADTIEKELGETLSKYNIDVVDISIENMDFTDAFEKAVEEKQVAQQNKLKSETQAEQKIIEAEADAKAKIIAAEAEAEAYRVQSSQITDALLKKWELDARQKHGWVTIQGANAIITQ